MFNFQFQFWGVEAEDTSEAVRDLNTLPPPSSYRNSENGYDVEDAVSVNKVRPNDILIREENEDQQNDKNLMPSPSGVSVNSGNQGKYFNGADYYNFITIQFL